MFCFFSEHFSNQPVKTCHQQIADADNAKQNRREPKDLTGAVGTEAMTIAGFRQTKEKEAQCQRDRIAGRFAAAGFRKHDKHHIENQEKYSHKPTILNKISNFHKIHLLSF